MGEIKISEKMRLFLSVLTAPILAEDNDCNKLQEVLFPNSTLDCEFEERTCSDGYFCYIKENTCDYQCISECSSVEPCENGEIQRQISVDVNDRPFLTCSCKDLSPDIPQSYECEVKNGFIEASASVPKIKKIHDDDNRNVTLISGHHYEEVQAAMAGNQLVTSFEKSLCKGIDKGNYYDFTNIVNGRSSNSSFCEFGEGKDLLVNGTLYKEYHFGIGWDDLIRTDLFGNQVVRSYGKHWNFFCRVKLQDILEGGFDSGGNRTTENITSETEYDFLMKLNLQYENGTIENYAGGEVDVSPETKVKFINVELTSNDASGMNLFVPECRLKMDEFENVTNTDVIKSSNAEILVNNGCLSPVAKNTNLYELLDKTENGKESLKIIPYDYNLNWKNDKLKQTIICEVRLCSKFGPDALGCQVTETCENERPNSFMDKDLYQRLFGQTTSRKRRQADDVQFPPTAILETEVTFVKNSSEIMKATTFLLLLFSFA